MKLHINLLKKKRIFLIQKDYVKAIQQLEDAARLTMPEMFAILKKHVLLSTLELHILMLYLYYGIMGNRLELEEGKKCFFLLEQYLYQGKTDINERAKCYPKLICIGLHLFQNSWKEREQMRLCQQAIDMLRENHTFHDIIELLRLYLPLLEQRESREYGFYRKQYEVFCDLLQSEGFSIGFQPEYLNRSKRKVYILNEYLLAKRTEKGMTQEMLSDGICAPETYSRIETGVRTPKPKNVRALTKKLGIDWCYYRGELDTCDIKAFELRTMQRLAEIKGRRYDSLDLLDDLEACLDMGIVMKVGFEQQWNGFSFVFRVLSGLYFAIGEYKTSIKIAEYVKHIVIKRRKGSSIPEILDEIADNLEHMGEQYSENYKKLYRYTYYIADFFGIEKIIDFGKKYYEEKFDSKIIWYESYLLSGSLR